ncbi:hypothetical protein IQ07DRAFT_604891 [Pyrenochaeta sp. DS3sAY3a]|nr:hypothetical protein IQ07DRAFT_604891 [Pyrenochaeta sp. DS3sAY3a]
MASGEADEDAIVDQRLARLRGSPFTEASLLYGRSAHSPAWCEIVSETPSAETGLVFFACHKGGYKPDTPSILVHNHLSITYRFSSATVRPFSSLQLLIHHLSVLVSLLRLNKLEKTQKKDPVNYLSLYSGFQTLQDVADSDWVVSDEWFSDSAIRESNIDPESVDCYHFADDLSLETQSYIFPQCAIPLQEQIRSVQLSSSDQPTQELSSIDSCLSNTSSGSSRQSSAQRSLGNSITAENLSGFSPQPIQRMPEVHVCKVLSCSKAFPLERQLKSHMRTHQRRIFSCDQCSQQYPHPKNLREHKQTKHDKIRYPCDVQGCTQILAQKKNLERHKRSKHP